MKITKTNKEVFDLERKKNIANIGCDKCPCCGESTDLLEAIKSGDMFKRGISSHSIRVPVKKGWFSEEYKNVDRYYCNRCGAEWESEPY